MTRHAPADAAPQSALAERVAKTRALHGLTQAELAALIGVSTAMVNRWERGHARPRAAHLILLERIEQNGPAPISDPAAPYMDLAAPLSSFVGRESELATLDALALRSRLLTLTGPGGAGKTRLALEIAQRIGSRFVHGVVLVELAGLTDPRLLDGIVAAAAGVREQALLSPRELLVHWLRERRLLLLLDNCEHLLAAAAELSAALLRGCPGLHIVATSRESLAVAGEAIWPVAPLTLPPAEATSRDAIARSEAVQLFVQRACERAPAFALTAQNAVAVAGICRRLDGLPLALELAAGWARVLSPAQIAVSLGERFPLLRAEGLGVPARHQTLEATIDWSYARLDTGERWVFARLAVFSGGFDLEALEAICAGGAAEGDAMLWLLDRLVNKSLVSASYQGAQPRFSLLETVRAYALARLQADDDEDAVRRLHAAYYLDLADQLAPQLEGPRQSELLAQLEREHENLRAALVWLDAQRDGAGFARLAAALIAFYESRSYLAEGRATLERALLLCPDDASLRLKLLFGLGRLAYRQNEFVVARARVAGCLPLAQQSGDPLMILRVLSLLGVVEHAAKDFPAARTHLETALQLAREHGITRMQCSFLNNLGLIASDSGDFVSARVHLDEALTISTGNAFWSSAAIGLHNSAHTARRRGDPDEARARHIAAMTLFLEVATRQGVAECLAGLALVAACVRQTLHAARLLGAAAAQFEASGGGLAPSYQAEHAAVVARVRAALGEQGYAAEWRAGAALSLDEAVAAASTAIPPAEPLPSRPAARPAAEPGAGPPLSPREREVLRLLASGATNREIAEALVLSVRTVEHHLLNLYAKTGTRGRADATAYALRHALISL